MSGSPVTTRPIGDEDRPWLLAAIVDGWGADRVVAGGRLTEPLSTLRGYVAERGGERVGYVLHRHEEDALEVVAIAATVGRIGVGTALLQAVDEEAVRAGASRAWLVTTNDNLDALRFYQRRGWELAALRRDAVTSARALKPEIPATGAYGIPLRDELEFERRYSQAR
jgi:ribosomal protein S18 acetylase RimI-like enzyme